MHADRIGGKRPMVRCGLARPQGAPQAGRLQATENAATVTATTGTHPNRIGGKLPLVRCGLARPQGAPQAGRL